MRNPRVIPNQDSKVFFTNIFLQRIPTSARFCPSNKHCTFKAVTKKDFPQGKKMLNTLTKSTGIVMPKCPQDNQKD